MSISQQGKTKPCCRHYYKIYMYRYVFFYKMCILIALHKYFKDKFSYSKNFMKTRQEDKYFTCTKHYIKHHRRAEEVH